jgi:hypothetical protein
MTEQENPNHLIVGTWRLISFVEEDLKTGAVAYPLGRNASAIVIYSADGFAATIFTSEGREPPGMPQATDQEAILLYRSMVAFAGRYHLDGDKLIYHPEISWNETWNGTQQERHYKMEDERLQVRSVPIVSTLTGNHTVFTLTWERAR